MKLVSASSACAVAQNIFIRLLEFREYQSISRCFDNYCINLVDGWCSLRENAPTVSCGLGSNSSESFSGG